MTTPKKPLAAVIGAPIAHSKSPILHGTWLTRYNIGGYYVPLHVEPDDLAQVLTAMPKMGFKGANITIPHKEAALALADHVTDRARRIGAANTLVFAADGSIQADNTDGIGFIENLKSGAPGFDFQGITAVVLGAGGAARAILVALMDEGVGQILLANRTRSRADGLAQEFGASIRVIDWDDVPQALCQAQLLVNTTSLGMTGKPPLDLDLTALPASALVTDLVYAPLETPLLVAARAKGCRTVDGLGMLLHQAAPGFEAWFGIKPQVDDDLRNAVLA